MDVLVISTHTDGRVALALAANQIDAAAFLGTRVWVPEQSVLSWEQALAVVAALVVEASTMYGRQALQSQAQPFALRLAE